MESLCPYYGECGGCQAQEIPYALQLARKEIALQELFAAHWAGPIPVTASPVIWHYRNKVDPVFSPKHYPEPPPPGFERETVLGFKSKGRWFNTLDIAECRIGPEGLPALLDAVRQWYGKHGLKAFDLRTGTGLLQALLVRDAKRTGERMVMLITREGPLDLTDFAEAVQEAYAPTSLFHGVYQGTADVAAADRTDLLAGVSAITERLEIPDGDTVRPLSFRISPFSFFQTNTLAAERLYGRIRQWVRETGAEVLYDLYGGMGSIAFACADLVSEVWSVENVAQASEDGRHNARVNGIENVTFITDKVKNYLKWRIQGSGLAPKAAVVVDPPRAGLTPKALNRLLELGPAHVLYVSCNPKILAQEMPLLLERYHLRAMHAVDMFPHTRHVETVAALERRA